MSKLFGDFEVVIVSLIKYLVINSVRLLIVKIHPMKYSYYIKQHSAGFTLLQVLHTKRYKQSWTGLKQPDSPLERLALYMNELLSSIGSCKGSDCSTATRSTLKQNFMLLNLFGNCVSHCFKGLMLHESTKEFEDLWLRRFLVVMSRGENDGKCSIKSNKYCCFLKIH